MKTAVSIARKHGYSVETWDFFSKDENLPDGLLERALVTKAELESLDQVVSYVLYDSQDNDQGFLVLGSDPEDVAWNLDGILSEDFEGMARPVPVEEQPSAPKP